MPHTADLYRPTYVQDTAQTISGYTKIYEDVPCFIQPMSSDEAMYYAQRGLEGMSSIYTTAVNSTFLRNDILKHNGEQYHIVGVKNALQRNIYIELSCYAYPEDAKKRLDTEAYE